MVWISPPRPCRRSRFWPHDQVSYLFADSKEELKTLARKIRIGPAHFRDHQLRPRFNVAPTKRAAAIEAGAVESATTARADACSHTTLDNTPDVV